MASIRAEKTFPPCESDIPEDQVKPLLDWANGGFLPKGEEGLKPRHSASEQGSSNHTNKQQSQEMLLCHMCVCVSLQTATRWTTRSWMSPCPSISPQSDPKSVTVRLSPAQRRPTAEVEVKGHTQLFRIQWFHSHQYKSYILYVHSL